MHAIYSVALRDVQPRIVNLSYPTENYASVELLNCFASSIVVPPGALGQQAPATLYADTKQMRGQNTGKCC